MIVAIERIIVGDRRREDFGDLDGLAKSIRRYGLFHPIVVDDQFNLVAGARRLKASQQLGLAEIEVKMLGELSEAERREIELEEDIRRKDLTAYERSKIMVGLAATASEVLRQQDMDSVRTSVQNPKSGRPKRPDNVRDVAQRIGVPPMSLSDATRHVETANEHPFMQGPGWKQYHVLEARDHLGKLDPAEQQAAVKLINQPGIPPKDGCEILGNLAQMPAPDRRRVFELNESQDARDRDLAVTTAANKPPMPDPRLYHLEIASSALKKAARLFPNDPITPRVRALVDGTAQISAAILQEGQSRDN